MAQRPVDPVGEQLDLRQVGEVGLGVVDRGPVALDGDHVAGRPDRLGERAGEQPDPGVEVDGPLPRLRLQAAEHGVGQRVGRAGVHLPEAGAGDLPVAAGGTLVEHGAAVGEDPVVGGADQPELLAGAGDDRLDAHRPGRVRRTRGRVGARGDHGQVGVADPAAVDGDDVVGAVLAQPDGAVDVDGVLHPGAPAEPVVVAGHRLDDDLEVEAGEADAAARARPPP